MRTGFAFDFLRKVPSTLCLVLLLMTWVIPNTPAQDKPKLRDFGRSLKEDSKKTQPQNSKPNNSDVDEVIRVQTDLVVSSLMVVDNKGNAILGLERSDFVISENGQRQEIGAFSLEDSVTLPRSIVLIIDYSRSQTPYIQTSVQAAKSLIDKLGPKDRMALVTDDVKLLVDFTQDKGAEMECQP